MNAAGVGPWADVLVACVMMLFLGVELDLLGWRRHSSKCGACGRILPRGETCHCTRR